MKSRSIVCLPARRAALLAGAAALSLGAEARTSGDCPPTAVISGEKAAAQELTKALVVRGLRVEPEGLPPGPCGVLQVRALVVPEGFAIWIGDPWGRTAERTVRDLLTAATLVESWARMDLLEGVNTTTTTSEPRPPAPEPALEGAAPTASVIATSTRAAAPAAPTPQTHAISAAGSTERLATPLLLQIGGEAGVGADRTKWIGAALSACGRLGAFCLGPTARYAVSEHRQHSVDVLLDLRAPISFGTLTLTPHLGAGGGWISRAQSGDDCDFGFCRSSFRDREAGSEGLGLRAAAGLTASLRLFDALHLQVGATGSAGAILRRRVAVDPHLTIVRAQTGLLWGVP